MAGTGEAVNNRDVILHKVRTALGRAVGQAPAPAPAALLKCLAVDAPDREARIASFIQQFEALAGKAVRTPTCAAAGDWLRRFLDGKTWVAAHSPFLAECGIATEMMGTDDLRARCAESSVGITSVDYALADTGSFVMLSSKKQPRLVSLLPPVHVAIFPSTAILSGLDELFTLLPNPAEQTSSMVLITGPSRTADIEQMLVRGVHGPGEIYAVIVGQ